MVTCVPASPLVGETEIMFGGTGLTGALTVTVVFPVTPAKVAVIFVVPGATGFTTARVPGAVSTVATAVFEEVHVAFDVRSIVLPSA